MSWYDGLLWDCCFGLMYVEWYGVCNFIVFSVVEICVLFLVLWILLIYVMWFVLLNVVCVYCIVFRIDSDYFGVDIHGMCDSVYM